MFKISFSNIFIMDANFADLCENVNNFSKDAIFASDRMVAPKNAERTVRLGNGQGKIKS